MANPIPYLLTGASAEALDNAVHPTFNVPYVDGADPDWHTENNARLKIIYDFLEKIGQGLVYPIGSGLNVGIFAVDSYLIGGTAYTYAGIASLALTNNADNYIWLDAAGLQTSTSAFAAGDIHKLAKVTTVSGAITAKLDYGIHGNIGKALTAWAANVATANVDFDGYNTVDLGLLNFDASAELTIASGAITVAQSIHTVDTQADAASDDLDTVTGTDGDFIVLFPENVSRVVTIKDGSGNVNMANGDFAMNAADKFAVLFRKGTTWYGIPSTYVPGTLTQNLDVDGYDFIDIGLVNLDDAAELTISSGAVTMAQTYHDIDTEADAASDDLDTISGGTAGNLVILKAENTARTVVVKHNTGNIKLSNSQDYSLDDTEKTLVLRYDGTNWCEVARSYWDIGDFEGTSKAIPLVYTWVISGSLSAGVIALKYKTPSEYDLEFVNAIGRVNTAPSGGLCIIDVQDDGASLFANEGEMINIADGTTSDTSATKNSTVAGGSVLSIEVKNTGGSPNGAANGTVVGNFRAPVKLGS